MRDCGDHYEYIAVYVDDLLIASASLKRLSPHWKQPHKFRLRDQDQPLFI
jgi:hypothetical protein